MRRWSRRQFARNLTVASASIMMGGCGLSLSSLGTLTAPAHPKVPVVGMLGPGIQPPPGDPNALLDESFRQGMRELGWVEGQNVAYLQRWGGSGGEGLLAAATDLVNQHVDLIWTNGPGIRAASEATSTIPIVMLTSGDLSQAAPASSFARAGGNVTGLAGFPELQAKRLELLKQAVPGVSRVALLWTATNTGEFNAAESAAGQLGVQLIPLQIGAPTDFPLTFQSAVDGRADALMTSSGPVFSTSLKDIVEFAASQRLPAMYYRTEYVDAGGLMAYGTNYNASFKRSAAYVDKILKGTQPADLPIEQPTVFDFAINLPTARTLGISIPREVLIQATRVIQ